MPEPAKVSLTLSNRAENVKLVRAMLSGLAEHVELDGGDHNDIRTAVTEACNNVVLHAYEGAEGWLEVEVEGAGSVVEVIVRDRGGGIRPRLRGEEDGALGIGLAVIQALAHSVQFSDVEGRGTEVRMRFETSSARPFDPAIDAPLEPQSLSAAQLVDTTGLALAPRSLARGVLPRILTVLAAQAHFTTDRICDVQLLADALVANNLERPGGDRLSMAMRVEPRSLELTLGPLVGGGARSMVDDSSVEGLGSVIERLADGHEVSALADGSELLVLRLRDRR